MRKFAAMVRIGNVACRYGVEEKGIEERDGDEWKDEEEVRSKQAQGSNRVKSCLPPILARHHSSKTSLGGTTS